MKVAVVTGAAGGIGAVLCKQFRDAGWQVIAIDKARPKNMLRGVRYHFADLSDDIQLTDLTTDIRRENKSINCLINCAAVQHIDSINDATAKQWDESMGVNVRAPFILSKQFMPQLEAGATKFDGTVVINIGSVHAKVTSANMTTYAASKAALHSLTRSMSIELGSRGIRVNTIAAGAVDTPMLTEHLTMMQQKQLLQRMPVKQFVSTEDIASLALYLTSSAARHITGQEFVIDSGALALLATEVA